MSKEREVDIVPSVSVLLGEPAVIDSEPPVLERLTVIELDAVPNVIEYVWNDDETVAVTEFDMVPKVGENVPKDEETLNEEVVEKVPNVVENVWKDVETLREVEVDCVKVGVKVMGLQVTGRVTTRSAEQVRSQISDPVNMAPANALTPFENPAGQLL